LRNSVELIRNGRTAKTGARTAEAEPAPLISKTVSEIQVYIHCTPETKSRPLFACSGRMLLRFAPELTPTSLTRAAFAAVQTLLP